MAERGAAERAESFHMLATELEGRMGRGLDEPLPEDAFNALALRAFALQYEGNRLYRAFCQKRGRTPEAVTGWEAIPAVPTTAFKYLDLVVELPGEVDRVFQTSGTSRGAEQRGRHLVPRLNLYRASLLPNLLAHLLPEGDTPPLISLIPCPEEAPHSSLSTMVGFLARDLCGEVHWALDLDGAPSLDAVLDAFEAHAGEEDGILMVGTAFGFVHLLDEMARQGIREALPRGSRIMETGGFKGRSRSVSRAELYAMMERHLGVAPSRVVNEYGMTELLSQMYEPVLLRPPSSPRRHRAPPWLRVRALDPDSLEPLEEGEEGLLAFFDLANAGSVCSILTEDVGALEPDGLRLVGRVQGSEPRGCSLALEDLLATREDHR